MNENQEPTTFSSSEQDACLFEYDIQECIDITEIPISLNSINLL